jgi:mono/diheme cytochrome c family protein
MNRTTLLAFAPATFLAAAAAGAGTPDEVTFTKDVAPIFVESCMTCHRPGEIAPMSLLSYDESRPWAGSIKREVEGRAMPPWHADPRYGSFSNDRRLTEEEVRTIVAWVDSGAPRGNPEDMPELPSFVEGWQLSYLLGPPDAVFPMEEEFVIPASGPDLNPNIEVPMPLDSDKWLVAAEVRGTRAWSITTSSPSTAPMGSAIRPAGSRAWSRENSTTFSPRARGSTSGRAPL